MWVIRPATPDRTVRVRTVDCGCDEVPPPVSINRSVTVGTTT